MQGFILTATTAAKKRSLFPDSTQIVDGRTDGRTNERTNGRKVEPLYRTLLKAGAIKIMFDPSSDGLFTHSDVS